MHIAAATNPEQQALRHEREHSTLLPWWIAALLIVAAGLTYWVAFSTRFGGAAILVALPCIFLLARLQTARTAFYTGALCALGMYVPQLWFFGSIFHTAAIAIWCIAALPIGIFTFLLYHSRQRFGDTAAMWLTPALWLGVEFFRSELYYLKFAWILPGQAAAFMPGLRMMWMGVYGLGFLYAMCAALLIGPKFVYRMIGLVTLLALAASMYVPTSSATNSGTAQLHVAGIQLEHPSESAVAQALDRLATAHPEAKLLVLSEYSFGGPVPESTREVVRRHARYLVAGGMVDEGNGRYRDTAFVIGPDGRDIFQQCKSVPVQLMSDGLPADQRRVWDSPWGKVGIAICYDVSYARVMDDFVRAGARGLIFPTMDLAEWGRYEREMLHGRLAPVRAAEYGVPVFGVWSSGESQLTDRHGKLIAVAGYPGQGEMIAGPFDMPRAGRIPPDRCPAFAASVFVMGLLLYFIGAETLMWRKHRHAGL